MAIWLYLAIGGFLTLFRSFGYLTLFSPLFILGGYLTLFSSYHYGYLTLFSSCGYSTSTVASVSCDRVNGRCPKLKITAQQSCTLYAPAASTVIRQFPKSFSTSFRSWQRHQTTCIYKGEDTKLNACRLLRVDLRNSTSDFMGLWILAEMG